jgi:hypothetical protein
MKEEEEEVACKYKSDGSQRSFGVGWSGSRAG